MDKKNNIVEEITEEVKEIENEVGEISSEIEENAKEIEAIKEELPASIQKITKHDEAKVLVDEAKVIARDAESQMDECRLLLQDDLKEYERAKKALKEGGLNASESLLEELGQATEASEYEDDFIAYETNEARDSIALKDVSSGKFTGFVLSLLGGLVILIGLAYLAARKLNLSLGLSVPSQESLQGITSFYSGAIGVKDNFMLGAGIMLLVALLVMLIIYFARIALKGRKNLRFANKQLAEAKEYSSKIGECKDKMYKADTHIQDAISLLGTYKVLLNEQKGKLQRIAHIEKDKIETSSYHEKSILEMSDTVSMIRAIKDFMSTPMSEDGKLSGKSTLFLNRAKHRADKVLERLY